MNVASRIDYKSFSARVFVKEQDFHELKKTNTYRDDVAQDLAGCVFDVGK